MTSEQKRIAIAEACGWKSRLVPREEGYGYATWWEHPTQKGGIPDYLNDLNAMHEAEKVLTEEQLRDYWSKLWLVVKPKTAIHLLCHATAAQRAEAFGLTLQLW